MYNSNTQNMIDIWKSIQTLDIVIRGQIRTKGGGFTNGWYRGKGKLGKALYE